MKVLDLFSAAAGGWSLGMHRAGFTTIAACELIEWRRVLYAQNNPSVRIYENVRTLTADRLVSELGCLPDVIVGSPPCQDISSANTQGKGVDGARSGLFFEAVRLIGECRPRWFALENSANLRTRGADRVLGALEDLGYACWPLVVRARDLGANHERPRCWLVGCDANQVAGDPVAGFHGWAGAFDAGGAVADTDHEPERRAEQSRLEGEGRDLSGDGSASGDRERTDAAGAVSGRHGGVAVHHAGDTPSDGRTEGRPGRRAFAAAGLRLEACGDDADRDGERRQAGGLDGGLCGATVASDERASGRCGAGLRDAADADKTRQADGFVVAGIRPAKVADDGCGDERGDDVAAAHVNYEGQSARALNAEVGGCAGAGGDAVEPWADWNGGLAGHLRVDDGLSARLALTRVAVGGGRGTAAASLVVEAFGDAVIPQIPEAIGAAIWRVEAAMAAVRRAA